MRNRDLLDEFIYAAMNYEKRMEEAKEMAEKHLDISFTDRKEEEGYGLKGAILFEEDGRHYLRLHYKKENGEDLYIPKLSLPIDQIPQFKDRYGTHESFCSLMKVEECYAIWGDIMLECEKGVITVPDNNGNPVKTPSPCHYAIVRPKKKMTKKEIEETLNAIKSWADVYGLLRESYKSNKLFNESFGCCKED